MSGSVVPIDVLQTSPTSVRRIAVVIVNWNAGNWLAKSVASVLRQTRPADRIVVVDNASTDGSLNSLQQFARQNLVVIKLDRNTGFAAANNVAIERCADCHWIALLNPDAVAEPRWLETLLQNAHKHIQYQFFASRQLMATDIRYLDGTGDAYHVSGLHWRSYHGASVARALETKEVFSACAAAAFYRADVLREIGGFDDSFFCYAEDIDIGFRLRLRGHRCLYVPEAVVHHVGSIITGRRSDFSVCHGHRNLVWVYIKNMPAALFWIYLPQHVLLNLISLLWFSLRGQAKVIFKAKWDAIKGLPRVWRERKLVQSTRRIGLWQLRKVMTKGIWPLLFR